MKLVIQVVLDSNGLYAVNSDQANGCWAAGPTIPEAIENFSYALQDWLEAGGELS